MLNHIIRRSNFTNFLRRSYHKNVVDHYDNPRNVGSFRKIKQTTLLWFPLH